MILEAGCDQFGGEKIPEMLVQLVKDGIISEDRIDVSVRRLMREKFILGLYDNPFVDPEAAAKTVGNPSFTRIANETQRRSYTLLTNNDNILPLNPNTRTTKFFAEGINSSLLAERNMETVDSPDEADYALLRLAAPYKAHPGGSGSLEFNTTEKARQAAIYKAVPTIVDLKFDRPVAIPEIMDQAAALLGRFGSSSGASLDVVFGNTWPERKLPYDLPRSMESVEAAMEDVPFDTRDPVFKFGHGLRYLDSCDADTAAAHCSN
jgi:hypothetical protein